MTTNIKSEPLYHVKYYDSEGAFVEVKVWQVPRSQDKPHGLRYAFAYIVKGKRLIGYDNAEGKGDHRHVRGNETAYSFKSLKKLWADFFKDIDAIKDGKL
jgi:hypothetical protein